MNPKKSKTVSGMVATDVMVKIDKGVPIPVSSKVRHYPWILMEVGDSFFVENISEGKFADFRSMASAAGRRYGRKYTTRREGTGVRIWRIE